jgi:hypothetical protein
VGTVSGKTSLLQPDMGYAAGRMDRILTNAYKAESPPASC